MMKMMRSLLQRLKPDSTIHVTFRDNKAIEEQNTTIDESQQPPARYLVAYWGIRGLGAPLRMMLSAAKVNHTIVMYDCVEENEGGESKWSYKTYLTDKEWLKQEYDPFMNLPFVVDAQEGIVLAQSNACLAYLGRQLGMIGQTKAEECKCEELLCEVMDLRSPMIRFAYGENASEGAAERLIHQAKCNLDKFERHLQIKYNLSTVVASDAQTVEGQNETVCHLVGNTFTAPDFHLFEMLDQYDGLCKVYTSLAPHLWQCYPALKEFYANFAQLPDNQPYLCSFLHRLPYNSPIAAFASAPDRMRIERGQSAPWRKQGVVNLQYDY